MKRLLTVKNYVNILGKGLFARKDYLKGELVTVSPILLMDKDLVMRSSSTPSVLMNYCVASEHSSLVMFPFALSALSNHASPRRANLEIELYWWNTDEEGGNKVKEEKMNTSLLTLSTAPYAQLDLGYRATKDVKRGEELLYSYGQDWQDAWITYSAEVSVWSETARKSFELKEQQRAVDALQIAVVDLTPLTEETEMPVFRQFIGGLDHLFLPAWRDLLPKAL